MFLKQIDIESKETIVEKKIDKLVSKDDSMMKKQPTAETRSLISRLFGVNQN